MSALPPPARTVRGMKKLHKHKMCYYLLPGLTTGKFMLDAAALPLHPATALLEHTGSLVLDVAITYLTWPETPEDEESRK